MTISGLRTAVGIATSGRPAILHETLIEIARQTNLPDAVFICPAVREDFDAAAAVDFPFPIHAVTSGRGLPAQRNAILTASRGFDVMIFFDDDFFPAPDYIAGTASLFATHPDITVATGRLLADGIMGPGIEVAAARMLLAAHAAEAPANGLATIYNAYGCNMCIRLKPVHDANLRFDEDLPLYGWLEDVDFCRRMSKSGRIVKAERLNGIHLGAKSGRTSGLRFGYSQIANPLHIWRKGSTTARWAIYHIGKNILANIYHAPFPEPWVDRRGRLKGNLLAAWDMLRRQLHPRRILEIR